MDFLILLLCTTAVYGLAVWLVYIGSDGVFNSYWDAFLSMFEYNWSENDDV